MSQHIDALVLDIEGTTTPISFVYETLFPYAERAFERFLREHEADIGQDLEALAAQAKEDRAAGVDAPEVDVDDIDTALANVRWQMEHDRKTTALKSLQGKIWRSGYESGELKGALFDDVLALLVASEAANVPVRIYSSGSVEAQKLLFGYSVEGDLTTYLSGYHDTTTGPKKVASSYEAIAEAMEVAPGALMFATDNLDEAKAAKKAGCQVVLMRRPGNPEVGDHDFNAQETFHALIEQLESQ